MKKINNFVIKNQRGVTIVEMLVYIGLLAIILVILTDMFVGIVSMKLDLDALSYNEQDGRFIQARIQQDINNSQTITTPASNGTITSTLVIVKSGVTYTYFLDGDYLKLTNNNGTFKLNSSETKIENLSFKRLGGGRNDTLQIKYKVTSKTIRSGLRTQSINFQSTVGIR